ncbi:MAG: aminotransferase class V-fold PLP-dependent enzyme [Deltaproteobacteria bacterium]|nr:aminotransferase class V-fold PLP-dependent enzyme [Deltaproteobacteria bacterium]
MTKYSSLIQHWHLDHETTFINHGSYGACPKTILEQQTQIRQELERQPVRFFTHELLPRMDAVRVRLGSFLKTEANTLALIPNATQGVNTVLRTYPLEAGDEVIVTNHGYNACNNAASFIAKERGACIKTATLPYPVQSSDQIVDAIESAITPQTKLAIIDHITSPTAVVTPIGEIVECLDKKGIDTLVDGAHAPGQIPIDLQTIGAAYYTGNCHKWLCTPKGSAFLYVREDKHHEVRPLAISHGANAPVGERSFFRNEFDWQGTHDPTAHMVIPAAIDLLGSWMEGGWDEIQSSNHVLALKARDVLCEALQISLPVPDTLFGSMVAIPLNPEVLPGGFPNAGLQKILMDDYRIEVPVFDQPYSPIKTLRISAQLYNHLSQYEHLALALCEIQKSQNIQLGFGHE